MHVKTALHYDFRVLAKIKFWKIKNSLRKDKSYAYLPEPSGKANGTNYDGLSVKVLMVRR